MDVIPLRRCGSCRHHRRGTTPATGYCGHPARQPEEGFVRPFVRDRELNCHQGFGRDVWELKPGAPWPPNDAGGGSIRLTPFSEGYDAGGDLDWMGSNSMPRNTDSTSTLDEDDLN